MRIKPFDLIRQAAFNMRRYCPRNYKEGLLYDNAMKL